MSEPCGARPGETGCPSLTWGWPAPKLFIKHVLGIQIECGGETMAITRKRSVIRGLEVTAAATALASLIMAGLPSLASAQEEDDEGSPTIHVQDCSTPEGRERYAARWARTQHPTMLATASRWQMSPLQYTKTRHDYVCWVLFDGDKRTFPPIARSVKQFVTRWECDVDWDEHCEGKHTITLPRGWQVCRLIYTISNRRGDTRFIVTPTNWLTAAYGPTGFRAFNLQLRADGSGAIFDRVGAHIVIENISLDAVHESLSVQERRSRGCEIRDRPAPPVPTPPEPPTTPGNPQPNQVQEIPGSTTERYRVIMRNPGPVPNNTWYEMWAYDPFWGREMMWYSGNVPLPPGGVWDYEFHKYGATRWRFVHRLLRATTPTGAAVAPTID